MARKWQETEFLDYRDRQVRRRTRKTRALVQPSEVSSGPSATFVVRGGLALLVVVLLVVGASRMPMSPKVMATPHYTVANVQGTVEYSTPTLAWTAVKSGDTFEKDIVLRVADGGRVTLTPPLPNARIVALGGASLKLMPLEVKPDSAQAVKMRLAPEKGVVMFNFRSGLPLVEVVLPQGTLVRGGIVPGIKQATFKVDVGADRSTVMARDGIVNLLSEDKSRHAVLNPDMLMAVKKGDNWDAPSRFNSTLESWE